MTRIKMLSAVVLTKNEEKNIEECLQALLWCDEIIVVDDYSEDKTKEIVRKQKADNSKQRITLYERKLGGNYFAQRNFGLKKAKGEWILFVDADERVSKDLAEEIKSVIEKDNILRAKREVLNRRSRTIKGYVVKRHDFFLGKWLKHGETNSVKLLRMAQKGAGKWEGKVHEKWEIKGKTSVLINPLLHYPHQTIGEFLKRINSYSSIRAEELYKSGEKSGLWQIILYPAAKFLQNYFIRLGFLDGMPGFFMALFMSFHSFLVRGKLYLLTSGVIASLEQSEGRGNPPLVILGSEATPESILDKPE
ncbi:MAG: glycosyltransferase family 2 protein [Patescibacteria group bacterium]|nr:glycosyltransferase family 2 protein [Patescibacteria group bacterium]